MNVLTGLIPTFLVILLGFGLRLISFSSEEIWRQIERTVYFVLFPALIVRILATADFTSLQLLSTGAALLAGLFSTLIIVSGLRRTIGPTMGLEGPAYSSVFQGSMRWNGFIALAAAEALYGTPGLTVASLAVAVLVPTVNVLSIATLSRHTAETQTDFRSIFKQFARNPLIIACLAGLALNISGIGLLESVEKSADLLGRAALALGLLAVGAGLNIKAMLNAKVLVFVACGLKLIFFPLAIAGFAKMFGVTGLSYQVAILCGAVPTASSSYILTRQFGGDATLMASIITATTLLSMLTMPLLIPLLSAN